MGLANFSNHIREKRRKTQDCYSLTNIAHTNAYIHDHALPRLTAVCADDSAFAAADHIEMVEDAGACGLGRIRGLGNCEKVEGWLADWGSGEGEGQT